MLGMGVLQQRVVLYLCSYYRLWGLMWYALGERLCSPSTVPRTTWEPPPNMMPFLRSLSNLLCSASSSLINNVAVSLDYSPLLSLSQLKILVVSYSVRRDI